MLIAGVRRFRLGSGRCGCGGKDFQRQGLPGGSTSSSRVAAVVVFVSLLELVLTGEKESSSPSYSLFENEKRMRALAQNCSRTVCDSHLFVTAMYLLL